jgi:site-specific DNA-methyltransferase (adenine-specific)
MWEKLPNCKLGRGDCLELMKEIPDGMVDLILCDLPYGTTACKWDAIIPFELLWGQYKRITKTDAAIVLTASQPFTSALITSNLKAFKYCWVWDKKKPSNFPLAKRQPMKYHEDIAVFSFGTSRYYPAMVPVEGRKAKKGKNDGASVFNKGLERPDYLEKVYTDKYPSSIIEVSNADQTNRKHPTQKPVALMEYLIKTYTKENEVVLDNCMGSGTTGVACVNLNRRFIGIEKDESYYNIAKERIAKAIEAKNTSET